MDRYELRTGLIVTPTPAGAYHAVAAPPPVAGTRRLLQALLRDPVAPLLDQAALERWTGATGDDALAVLAEAHERAFVEGHDEPVTLPAGSLEELLPTLLGPLSERGEALLADSQGFVLASVGFDDGEEVELAALGAELAALAVRRAAAVDAATRSHARAWALVDAVGNSQVGFWPLFIGEHRFVLAVGGLPLLNRPQLTHLVWALNARYGGDLTSEDAAPAPDAAASVPVPTGGNHA